MKKYVNPIPNGGAPLHNNRITSELQTEIWEAMQSLLARYSSDTQGVIVSGCVISDNAGNFDITAGIVFLNGEFMRLAAATNQTFTKYIAPKAVTYEQKTFADSVAKNLIEVKEAELVGSAPGSGQYITIANLTDPLTRRHDQIGMDDTIQLIIDGGGATILTGAAGFVEIGYDCEIIACRVYGNTSGSIAVDLQLDTYANFPPTGADSIVASAPPTLSSAQKSEDTTLTGWSKTLPKGKILNYVVSSVTGLSRVTIVLAVKRTK